MEVTFGIVSSEFTSLRVTPVSSIRIIQKHNDVPVRPTTVDDNSVSATVSMQTARCVCEVRCDKKADRKGLAIWDR